MSSVTHQEMVFIRDCYSTIFYEFPICASHILTLKTSCTYYVVVGEEVVSGFNHPV